MSRPPARRRAAQAGFTFVELIMGIVLAAIFAGALYGFFFAGLDAARSHESQARAQAAARTALERFSRDVRQAISPDDGLTPPVASVSAAAVEVYVDGRRDLGSTSPRPQRVRYALAGAQLIRERSLPAGAAPPFTYGPYGAREVLVDGVTNGAVPVFRAMTREGVALPASVSGPQARDVASVSIRLRVAQKTGVARTTLELATDVALRNAVRL